MPLLTPELMEKIARGMAATSAWDMCIEGEPDNCPDPNGETISCEKHWREYLAPYTADPSKPAIIEPEFAVGQEVWTIHCTRKGYVSSKRNIDGFMVYKDMPLEYMASGLSKSAKDIYITEALATAECRRRNEATP